MATTNDNSVITRGFLKAYHSRLLPLIPDVSGLESTSNKVSAWSATTNNTHYPTEKLVKDSLDAKQNTINASNKLSASLVSGLATVATSGSYDDLSNKPTIGNATLTIKVAGTTKGTFTANQNGTGTNIDITASDLGLSNAMHFKGVVSSKPTPTTTDAYNNGDVIIVGKKEYVRYGKTSSAAGDWEELGDASSYALNSVKISAGEGLTGGGDLSADRTISHATQFTEAKSSGFYKVAVDKFGHITSVTNVAKADITGLGIPAQDTWIALAGATSSANGTAGYAPQPKAGDQGKFLKGNGTWSALPTASTSAAGIIQIGTGTSNAAAGNHNHDSDYKKIQTAVTDPDASGTSVTFISTISQNTGGVITATKKTVSTMGAASSSAAGSAGLVPAPAKGDQAKYLKGNGTWATVAYSELSGAPSDKTFKLQINSTDIASFTAKGSADVTTNLFNTATYDNSTTSDTDLNYIFA